jgi:hypothetical protein
VLVFLFGMKDVESGEKKFVEVAVGLPVEKTFTYEIPSELRGAWKPDPRSLQGTQGDRLRN